MERNQSAAKPVIFNLLDVAAEWTADQLGPCIGDDSETTDDGVAPASDLRLKTDIAVIGTTALGLPLYRFRYKGQEAVYSGVMAQDVLNVLPTAVLIGADGFYRVNYRILGISMERLA
jgi:hypothetical protein